MSEVWISKLEWIVFQLPASPAVGALNALLYDRNIEDVSFAKYVPVNS